MSGKGTICVAAFGLVLAIPGFADIRSGNGAGFLPGTALNFTSDPNLTEITGTLDSTDRVAMFEILIPRPLNFSAYTVYTGAFGIPNPELFLFDSSGNGVYMNDDRSSVDTQACLPSAHAFANMCPATSSLGPLTPGDYFLAITPSANNPLDGSSNYIFSPVLSTDVVGPSAGVGPIASWDGGFSDVNFDNAKYEILISDAPEPAAWPVTVALCLGLILFRRRLRTR